MIPEEIEDLNGTIINMATDSSYKAEIIRCLPMLFPLPGNTSALPLDWSYKFDTSQWNEDEKNNYKTTLQNLS